MRNHVYFSSLVLHVCYAGLVRLPLIRSWIFREHTGWAKNDIFFDK